MSKATIKEVISSDNWIVTKVLVGLGGQVRIDARTWFRKPDSENSFSKWCSEKYAQRQFAENGKSMKELGCYTCD